MSHRLKFGVEIELGYARHPTLLPWGWKIVHDGSVVSSVGYHSREINTRPYGEEELEIFADDLRKVYSRVRDVDINSSMGLHVHISSNQFPDYVDMFSWEFVNKFQKSLVNTRNEVIKKMTQGRLNNHFCTMYRNKNSFIKSTQEQVRCRDKCNARYRAVNYNSYNIHNTIEFRIFRSSGRVEYIKEVVKYLLDFIKYYLKGKKGETIEYVIPDNILAQENITITPTKAKTLTEAWNKQNYEVKK